MLVRLAGASAILAALAGCRAELVHGLDEAAADEVVLALDGAGIAGAKERVEGGEGSRYRVLVADTELVPAMAVLREQGLPRARPPGLEALFEGGGLVPSAAEERARVAAASSGELSRSLEALDGVVGARVHLALPDPSAHRLDDAPPRARASVLITHRSSVNEAAVRRLVAGAVSDLAEEDVAVVTSPVARTAARPPSLVAIGPIAVSRGSAGALKAILGGSLALNVVLAAVTVWSRRRGARGAGSRGAAPSAERREA